MPVEYSPPYIGGLGLQMDNEPDIFAQVREATNSPSPLMRILQDPSIMQSPKTKQSKDSRRSSSRERRSPMVVALAIAEEERQANHLKALLRSTGDRLEFETRRTEEANARAESSERRVSELLSRVMAIEAEKREVESGSFRMEQEAKRYQYQLEAVERELKRKQEDLRRLQKENDEIREEVDRAREISRNYQMTLREHEAREEGLSEARQLRMDKCFNDGKEEGWDMGYDEGFNEGRTVGYKEGLRQGRKEGLKEGREQGQIEERKNALDAFDKFLASEELAAENDERNGRTRRWAQSIYHPTS